MPVALPVLIPVPVLFSASAASAAKFHTEKALVLASKHDLSELCEKKSSLHTEFYNRVSKSSLKK